MYEDAQKTSVETRWEGGGTVRETIFMRPNITSGFLFAFCGAEEVGRKEILCRLQNELEVTCLQQFSNNQEHETTVIQVDMSWLGYNSGPYCSLSFVEWSMRLKAAMEEIEEALRKGKIVLCEGYWYSCVAHCCVPEKWVHNLVGSIVQPDAIFLFEESTELVAAVQHCYVERDNVVAITGGSQEERYRQAKETIERVIKNDRK